MKLIRNIMPTALAALFVAMALAGCASVVEKADRYAAQDEWMRAVLEYRKAVVKHPDDVEYRSRLKQTELKAADHYYQRGMAALERQDIDGAIINFQQGLAAMPDHAKLLQVMNQALQRKEAASLYQEALRNMEAGKSEEGRRLLRRTLDMYPDHRAAAEALAKADKSAEGDGSDRLAMTSKAPITLNFRQTDLRTAFEFIAKSFGVNVIFDEGVRSLPVTLYAKDVTFEQGLNLLLATTKTFYKKIGTNTILIAPDSKDKRGQYEDQIVRTFVLVSVRAKEMSDIVKGLLNVKKMIVNEQLNTLVVRDSADTIKLVERLIEANDKKPAEMILEVEILEVNRSKAEKLGLDLGTYQVSAGLPEGGLAAGKSISKQLASLATLTLPSATFRFYKQDVDAKTLANPKVRVLSGKAAKIQIGDRVPLRASTINDALSGQVRTTYDYKDIGIRLNVEPMINLDNSAMVKVALEVSSLGQNVGTANEPAYQIGTRNAETFMLLRDGETAILGGLIRDEDRGTRVRVPILGDIPALGMLFTSSDTSSGRTDVLLTITPRIVRGWDLPNREAREFYSGAEDRYMTEPMFAQAETATTSDAQPVISRSESGPVPAQAAGAVAATATAAEAGGPAAGLPAGAPIPAAAGAAVAAAATIPKPGQPAVMSFNEAAFEASSGSPLEIGLVADNLAGVREAVLEVLYNPQLLKFDRGRSGDVPGAEVQVQADEGRGVMRVTVTFAQAPAAVNGVIARIGMQAAKPGVSYLVYKTPQIKTASGEPVTVQVRASRVLVK